MATDRLEARGRRVVLLRHGQTAWNAEGRAQGHADPGLDDVGQNQAEAVAPAMAALADAARRGALGRLTVEKADGQALIGSGGETPIRLPLTAAGFLATPKGLRLRA